jgi:hypothetical protein
MDEKKDIVSVSDEAMGAIVGGAKKDVKVIVLMGGGFELGKASLMARMRETMGADAEVVEIILEEQARERGLNMPEHEVVFPFKMRPEICELPICYEPKKRGKDPKQRKEDKYRSYHQRKMR